MDLKPLLIKYSKPGPRYTSYPTAPQWTEDTNRREYREKLAASDPQASISLYLHIPFCESLCYYCGCNIKLTHDHGVEHPYVNAVISEIKTVAKHLGSKRTVNQVCWGGGTPTFLAASEIKRLQECVKEHFTLEEGAEVSMEIDPRVTSNEQLEVMREVGFNRVSLGVQDFDPQVQEAVNRIQSESMTAEMLNFCRSLGYTGINFDLIYGLPFQTLTRFTKTIESVVKMGPDRIAIYNYAHLPSLRPHQKILEKFPMPDVDERLAIFECAYHRLQEAGYVPIGMDHFARQDDELAKALTGGSLYRNFQGYSIKRARNLIGLGASAIGELEGAYFQNLREVQPYQEAISGDEGLATFRGCLLNPDDTRRKWIIERMMCQFEVNFDEYQERFNEDFSDVYSGELNALEDLQADGLTERSPDTLKVTPLGRLFVRNAAMVFDAYLGKSKNATYSKTL